MLIGIDASRANKSHKSGTEWYSYYLIRWLAKIDKDNQYILYSPEPLRGGLLDLTTKQYRDKSGSKERIEFDKKGFQIIKSPYNNFRAKILKWPFFYFWTQGRLSLEMLFSPPDILFVPSHTLSFIHPKKSIMTVHDIGFERDYYLYSREQILPGRQKDLADFLVKIISLGKYRANFLDYLKWSTQYALKHAWRIITVSEFTKQEIKDVYGLKRNNIFVVHNGYNKLLYKKIDDRKKIKEILNKYDIETPYFFYIGRLERKKNIPALIEAFALFKEQSKNLRHKLVLVGDASYGYDEINYLIHQYRLIDDVIMPGWVDELDVPYLYSGAEAFIFPSCYEGFGIPLLQAMATRTPILASKAASIPEVVGEAAILFNPNDIFSMAQAMKKIVSNRQLREDLVNKGIKRVKNFSWEKCAQQTLKNMLSK